MKINWVILYLAFSYSVLETAYFGWHRHPASPAEMICDGIVMVIAALAFLEVRRD